MADIWLPATIFAINWVYLRNSYESCDRSRLGIGLPSFAIPKRYAVRTIPRDELALRSMTSRADTQTGEVKNPLSIRLLTSADLLGYFCLTALGITIPNNCHQTDIHGTTPVFQTSRPVAIEGTELFCVYFTAKKGSRC